MPRKAEDLSNTALVGLATDLVDYWVAHELRLVETVDQVRESIANFNRDAPADPKVTIDMLGSYTYWILDSQTGKFGPNKFVGYIGMTLPKYKLSQRMERLKLVEGYFNGGKARTSIQRAVGRRFVARPELHPVLFSWATDLLGVPEPFGNSDPNKWEFLVL